MTSLTILYVNAPYATVGFSSRPSARARLAHSFKPFLPSMQQSFLAGSLESLLLLFQLVFKAVADFADGMNERRAMRVGLDLAPQRGYATIHAARGDHDAVAPDGVHDAVSSERAPGVLEKVFEEAELFVRERHFDAVLEPKKKKKKKKKKEKKN